MVFADDTEDALVTAAALVNTALDGAEGLPDLAALDGFLAGYPMTGDRRRTNAELLAVRELRDRLRAVWESDDVALTVAIVNAILADTDARPYLTRHDPYDWHLHVTEAHQPLADRMGAEAAMGFVDLIRAGDLERLKICAADDCRAVVIDLSKNKSRRFCDTGNCANRAHVAAYRARRRANG